MFKKEQIIFDGTPQELEASQDHRVWQFLHGVGEMENSTT